MNAHPPSRWLLFLPTLLLLSISHSMPARAQAPQGDALMQLDDRLVRARKVRITTAEGWTITQGTRADVEGLTYRAVHSASLGSAPAPSGRLAWERISQVDVPANHGLRYGLITGLVLTGVCAALLIPAASNGGDIGGGGIIIVAIPLGALIAT